jgi:acetyltransferase-like isoleucine patch superfamily enzyme
LRRPIAREEEGEMSEMTELVREDLVIFAGRRIVDPTARVGYVSGRSIELQPVTIGDGAIIRSGSVLYVGSRIGERFETGHNVVIREQNEIGDDVQIWNNSVVDYGCKIGNRVHVHCNVYIAQFTILEDGVFLAPGVVIANDIHPGCADSRQCMQGPHLERLVRVGVNATILPFVRIGEGSLIGSGAVVTRDIPPRSVVAGNPGRVLRGVDQLTCVRGRRSNPYGSAP